MEPIQINGSRISLYRGDCLEIMPALPENSIDAIVTDPPYHLTQKSRNGSPRQNDPETPFGRTRLGSKGFMGKTWDGGGVAFDPEMWERLLRVAKPGAHLLAFGGTRTFHRLACAIEDAGWEIRDCIMWVYGSGFPKSLDVSKAIDRAAGAERPRVAGGQGGQNQILGVRKTGEAITGEAITDAAKQWQGWGTTLKPAWEAIVVARKPLEGSVAANVLKWGTGGINVDECMIATSENLCGGAYAKKPMAREKLWGEPAKNSFRRGGAGAFVQSQGRWPANLIHDGSEEVVGLFPQQSSGGTPLRRFAKKTKNSYGDFNGQENVAGIGPSCGSAARFFYCAKANKADRGPGNNHPTVKPTTLMAYLCRLVTPPDGLILDPFMGSGSTGVAALREGFRFFGIEVEAESFATAERRIKRQAEKPRQQVFFQSVPIG
jgi:site-specific DNA-methyltransferase (adenine-specific)